METSDPERPSPPGGSSFVTTHWTRVLEARGSSPESRAALSELCQAYYAPVVAFLRRGGAGEDLARDEAHSFFAHILERNALEGVERDRGRFRSYLLGALKHFLARAREHEQRRKRGGGTISVPLDSGTDSEPGLSLPDPNSLPPDEYFDRQWALTVLERALTRVEGEWKEAGRGADFQALKPWLTGDAAHGDQAVAAGALGMSDGAVKVAVHRLRRRFREAVRQEVAHTLNTPDQVAAEMRQLFAALGG